MSAILNVIQSDSKYEYLYYGFWTKSFEFYFGTILALKNDSSNAGYVEKYYAEIKAALERHSDLNVDIFSDGYYRFYRIYDIYSLLTKSDSFESFYKSIVLRLEKDDIYGAYSGDRVSQFSLGMRYLEGFNCKVDVESAIKWLCYSFKLGFKRAGYELCKILLNIHRDVDDALEYLVNLSSQGHYESSLYLAELYYDGVYVKRDSTELIKCLEKCANNR